MEITSNFLELSVDLKKFEIIFGTTLKAKCVLQSAVGIFCVDFKIRNVFFK